MKTQLDKTRKLIGKALRNTEEAAWHLNEGEKVFLANELIHRLNLQQTQIEFIRKEKI